MSYRIDSNDENAIVMEGVSQGIASSPYEGISDMRNMNIISIPDEASVNFTTSKISFSNANGSVVSSDSSADTITISGTNLSEGQTIIFSSSTIGGVSINTPYWVLGNQPYQLYTDPSTDPSTLVNITGASGVGNYTTIDMGIPKYFNHLTTPYIDCYFMVDGNGLVWTNMFSFVSFYWRYAGNTTTGTHGSAHGNGLVSYVPSDSNTTAKGYLFVFRDFQIDYATISGGTTITWTYGWNPADGTSGNNNYLKCATSGTLPSLIHEAIVGPDNKVYYCDSNWIGRFYQASTNTGFLPATKATYVADNTAVLPFIDTAQCLAFSGNNLLIGGKNNIIYPWDTFSQLPQYPIFIAESNVVKMVTVNTNTYILSGNRGRIYVTNGSQAQLFKKIPDHLSGTVEPYYTWGGLASNKNQIYFSALVQNNAGSNLNVMGGIWAIDLGSNPGSIVVSATQALRMVNQLSYGTYTGYASAIIPNYSSEPAGTGLFMGWYDGVSSYGIDTTIGTPYTNSRSYIDFDLIPVSTILKPKTFKTVEYKLSVPMVAGESISIYSRLNFSDNFNLIFTDIATSGYLPYSGNNPVNFENAQWIQLRAVTNSVSNSPSYVRLKEIRIK